MAAKDLLSQEEIDALLQGVDEGEIETGTGLDTSGVQAYDFTTQNRIVRGRMPTLEMINERFARHFRVSLFNFLRRFAEVGLVGIQVTKFSDYIRGLPIPTNLNMVRCHPLWGRALFVLDAKLVLTIVDNFFGGGQFYNKYEGREFTPTEMRVVRLLLDIIFKELKEAWKPVFGLEFEYLNSETNPLFSNIVSPTEVVVVSTFHIDLSSGAGDFQIVMPYSMIEPIRELLHAGIQSDRGETDDRWYKALEREIMNTEVTISSTLLQKTFTIDSLLKLKAGDVIPISLPDRVVLNAESIPICVGKVGVSNGQYAIEIESRIEKGGASA
jgi:flagellar motor switch protein FliM